MNAPTLAYCIALSTVGGILIPIMAALSGGLGRTLDNPWAAAAIVSGGGFALVLAATDVCRRARDMIEI